MKNRFKEDLFVKELKWDLFAIKIVVLEFLIKILYRRFYNFNLSIQKGYWCSEIIHNPFLLYFQISELKRISSTESVWFRNLVHF